MAATQTLSTGSNSVASTLRRRAAELITCAHCNRRYTLREAEERRVTRARTEAGAEFLLFRCECGHGSTVAGAVAYNPATDPELGAGELADISHCAEARKMLTADALTEARKKFEIKDRNRADVIDRMERQKDRLVELQLATQYMSGGAK
jgi:hypothetical protein